MQTLHPWLSIMMLRPPPNGWLIITQQGFNKDYNSFFGRKAKRSATADSDEKTKFTAKESISPKSF